jgi:hypothetical protein
VQLHRRAADADGGGAAEAAGGPAPFEGPGFGFGNDPATGALGEQSGAHSQQQQQPPPPQVPRLAFPAIPGASPRDYGEGGGTLDVGARTLCADYGAADVVAVGYHDQAESPRAAGVTAAQWMAGEKRQNAQRTRFDSLIIESKRSQMHEDALEGKREAAGARRALELEGARAAAARGGGLLAAEATAPGGGGGGGEHAVEAARRGQEGLPARALSPRAAEQRAVEALVARARVDELYHEEVRAVQARAKGEREGAEAALRVQRQQRTHAEVTGRAKAELREAAEHKSQAYDSKMQGKLATAEEARLRAEEEVEAARRKVQTARARQKQKRAQQTEGRRFGQHCMMMARHVSLGNHERNTNATDKAYREHGEFQRAKNQQKRQGVLVDLEGRFAERQAAAKTHKVAVEREIDVGRRAREQQAAQMRARMKQEQELRSATSRIKATQFKKQLQVSTARTHTTGVPYVATA